MTNSGTGAPDNGAPFTVVAAERPFTGHIVSVRVDRILGRDGRKATREVVEHPGAVAAIVVDDAGRIVLVEQWRQALGRRMLEIVAGKYDQPGEEPEDTLRRELAEELGLEGGRMTFMTSFATTPGWGDEVVDLYLIEGARPMPSSARPPADWEEIDLTAVAVPFEEALRLATTGADGAIGDAKTLSALGLYGLYRAGAWAPEPDARPALTPARRRALASGGQRPPG